MRDISIEQVEIAIRQAAIAAPMTSRFQAESLR
jgi:hypothetical protein